MSTTNKESGNKSVSERRSASRLACDGVAEVSVLGGALRFRGQISDLSLSGCHICTASGFNLERGTELEIGLRLNGLMLRVGGSVRVVDGRSGIGVAFTHVSARTGRYIRQLMAELQPAAVQMDSTAVGDQ